MSLLKVKKNQITQPKRVSQEIESLGDGPISLVSNSKNKDIGSNIFIDVRNVSNNGKNDGRSKAERVSDAINRKRNPINSIRSMVSSDLLTDKTEHLECLITLDYNPDLGKSIQQLLEAKQIESIVDDKIQKELIKLIEKDPRANSAWVNARKNVESEIENCTRIYGLIENYSNIIREFSSSLSVNNQNYNLGSKFKTSLESLKSRDSLLSSGEGRGELITEIASKLTSISPSLIDKFDLHHLIWLALTDINATIEWGISPGYIIDQNSRTIDSVSLDRKIKMSKAGIKKLSELSSSNSYGITPNSSLMDKIAYYSSIITSELKYSLGTKALLSNPAYAVRNANLASFRNSLANVDLNVFSNANQFSQNQNTSNQNSSNNFGLFKTSINPNSSNLDPQSFFGKFLNTNEKIAFFADPNAGLSYSELSDYKFPIDSIAKNFLEYVEDGSYQNYKNSIENIKKEFDASKNIIEDFSLTNSLTESSILHSKNLFARIIESFCKLATLYTEENLQNSSIDSEISMLILSKFKPTGLGLNSPIPKDWIGRFLYNQIYKSNPNYQESLFKNEKFEISYFSENYQQLLKQNAKLDIKDLIVFNVRDKSQFARLSNQSNSDFYVKKISNVDQYIEGFTDNSEKSLISEIILNLLKEIEEEYKRVFDSINISLDGISSSNQLYKTGFSSLDYTIFLDIILRCFCLLFDALTDATVFSGMVDKQRTESTSRDEKRGGSTADRNSAYLRSAGFDELADRYDENRTVMIVEDKTVNYEERENYLRFKKINSSSILFLLQFAQKLKSNRLFEYKIRNSNSIRLNPSSTISYNENLFLASSRPVTPDDCIEIGNKLIGEVDIIKNLFAISKSAFDNFYQTFSKLQSWYDSFISRSSISNSNKESNSLIEFIKKGNINLLSGLDSRKKKMFQYKISKLKNAKDKNYDITYDSFELFEFLKNYNQSLINKNKNFKFVIVSLNNGTISEKYQRLSKKDGNLNVNFKVSKIDNLLPNIQYEDKIISKINGCLILDEQNFDSSLKQIIKKNNKIDFSSISSQSRRNYNYFNLMLEEPVLENDKNSSSVKNLLETQAIRILIQKIFDFELDPVEMNDIILDIDSNNMSQILNPIASKFKLNDIVSMIFDQTQDGKLRLKKRDQLNKYILDSTKKIDSSGKIYHDLKSDIFQIIDSLYTLMDSFIFKSSSIQNYVFFDDKNYYDGVWGLKFDPNDFVSKNSEGLDSDVTVKSNVNLDSYYISCEFS